MKVTLKEISIADLFNGFINNEEKGVFGYGGKLNIRPPYQREFVYKDDQRREVINTVRKNFPLNIMYWSKNSDNTYELLDGQQRTMSICTYLNNDFSISERYFHSLTNDEQQQILNYKIMVYICEGGEREKLDWFKIVNIAGEKLTNQELRNSVYTGPWLSDAKRYFSGSNAPANDVFGKYLSGSSLRQEVLETVLKWISDNKIEEYMSSHHHNSNSKELWDYFNKVVEWTKSVFPEYRKIMTGLPWGEFYNQYKDQKFEEVAEENERRISELIEDEEVTNKKGIYGYILSDNDKYLNLRTFDNKTKIEVYEKQRGVCPFCQKYFNADEMEADHIVPWSRGGKTTPENCQMLCRKCNNTKSNR